MPFLGPLYYALTETTAVKPAAPLVLLHGAGSSHLVWPAGMRRRPDRAVYAPDWPGHGRSEGVACASMAELADAAADFAHQVWLSPAVWCGHSLGAAAALELAVRHPQLVGALVLISGAAFLPVEDAEWEMCQSPETYPAWVEARLDRLLEPAADHRLRARVRQTMLEMRIPAVQRDLAACRAWNFADRVGRVRAPVLVMAGQRDRMVPMHSSRALAEALPNARLVEIPEAGHLCMLEREEEVTAAVTLFLDDLIGGANNKNRPLGRA